MRVQLLRFVCIVLLVMGTAGCAIFVLFPEECRNEAPTLDAQRGFHIFRTTESARPPWPTRQEFLDTWGRPDRIEYSSEDTEIWIYDRTLWCGVIPIYMLPAPLVFPVCDGFERVEFRGDRARVLHVRKTSVLGIGETGIGVDEACRNQIPIPSGSVS